jgi:hypothetical protein
MKATLVHGREFDAGDIRSAPWVAVINETAAQRFWPGQDPIGKRFRLDVVPTNTRGKSLVVHDLRCPRRRPIRSRSCMPLYLQQPTRYRGPWANMFGQMTFLLARPAIRWISCPPRGKPSRMSTRSTDCEYCAGGFDLERACAVGVHSRSC